MTPSGVPHLEISPAGAGVSYIRRGCCMSSMTAVLPDRRARPAGGHPAFKDTLHSPTTPGRPDRASSGDEAGRIMRALPGGGDIFFLSSLFVLPLPGERAGVRGTAGTAPVLAITGISPSSAASRHLPPGGRWPSRLNFADGTGPLRLCLWQNHFPRTAGAENGVRASLGWA